MEKARTLEISADCSICQSVTVLTVNAQGWHNWRNRVQVIQSALPELSKADRELLISKTCGICWLEMFGEPEQPEKIEPEKMIGHIKVWNVTEFRLTLYDLKEYGSFTDIFQFEYEECFYLIGLINRPDCQESATIEFKGSYWLDQVDSENEEEVEKAEERLDAAMAAELKKLGIEY